MKKSNYLVALATSLTLVVVLINPARAAVFTNDGKVVNCSAIKLKSVSAKGTTLSCLDQSTNIKLEAITGPTLINVWGSWCAPCRGELPLLRDAYRSGKVKIVGIDVEEPSAKTGQNFAIKAGITWPNLFDGKGITKGAFGIGVPVTWFLNKNGVVTYKHIGAFTSAKQLSDEVGKYLG